MPIVTFVIPVRHQDNASNWASLKANLAETIGSIAAQSHPDWQAVIVANRGADLPELPPNFDVAWVDFDANTLHEKGENDLETFYEAFRFDKGRRVLSGMLHSKATGHFMIVDDDDFVSNKLVAFVAANRSENGWYIRDGYLWGHGGNLVYRHPSFAEFCGTSLIIRADLYGLPQTFESASTAYICSMLGSHRMIKDYLDAAKTPIAPLPFFGAVYRIGHAGAHSKSGGLLRHLFARKDVLRRPAKIFDHLSRLRRLRRDIRREFFGTN